VPTREERERHVKEITETIHAYSAQGGVPEESDAQASWNAGDSAVRGTGSAANQARERGNARYKEAMQLDGAQRKAKLLEALEQYTQAHSLDRRSVVALNNRAAVRLELQQPAEAAGDAQLAIATAERYVGLGPEMARAFERLGKAEAMLQRPGQAVEALERASQLFKTKRDEARLAVLVREQRGKMAGAQEAGAGAERGAEAAAPGVEAEPRRDAEKEQARRTAKEALYWLGKAANRDAAGADAAAWVGSSGDEGGEESSGDAGAEKGDEDDEDGARPAAGGAAAGGDAQGATPLQRAEDKSSLFGPRSGGRDSREARGSKVSPAPPARPRALAARGGGALRRGARVRGRSS
jgi:tetratricopeptide (TPR) repeat protein